MTYTYRDEVYVMADDADIIKAIADDHWKTDGERRTHPRRYFTTDYECGRCHTAWPCDAALLVAASGRDLTGAVKW